MKEKILTIMFSLFCLTAVGQNSVEVGDVDGNGDIDFNDVSKLVSHLMGKTPDVFNLSAADVNDDGKVNVADVTSLINIINEPASSLPEMEGVSISITKENLVYQALHATSILMVNFDEDEDMDNNIGLLLSLIDGTKKEFAFADQPLVVLNKSGLDIIDLSQEKSSYNYSDIRSIKFVEFSSGGYNRCQVPIEINNGGQVERYEYADSITINGFQEPTTVELNVNFTFPCSDIMKDSYHFTSPIEDIVKEINWDNPAIFKIKAYTGANIQTFFINDGEKVYMMARDEIFNYSYYISIDSRTSALALVTLHPLLAPVKANDYYKLTNLIESCSSYSSYVDEVEKAINEGRDLFDINNDDLIKALGKVLDELFSKINEPEITYDIYPLDNNSNTRGYNEELMYPFYSEVYRNKLILRSTGLTPSYYGTVSHKQVQDKISILSRNDYGFVDCYTKSYSEMNLGPECIYYFTDPGSYIFHLSRTVPEAQLDFCLKIAYSLVSSIGVELSDAHMVEIVKIVEKAMVNLVSDYPDESYDYSAWIGVVYQHVLKYIENYARKNGKDALKKSAKFLSSNWNFYSKTKAAGNMLARLVYGLKAPADVYFTLYYDGEKVSSDCTAYIEVVDGDNQIGDAGKVLPKPLIVKITTLNQELPQSARVVFSAGGGGKASNKIVKLDNQKLASVEWTLGKRDIQYMTISLVDLITGENICPNIMCYADFSIEIGCPDDNHPHAIDLGLPSGTLWSCTNVGANSPIGYGGLYAWGETTTKETYTEKNYKFVEKVKGGGYIYTKYCTEDNTSSYWQYRKDGNTILDASDDAATVNMGAGWRMPTYEEIAELYKNCKWERITGNQIRGMMAIINNGKKMFFPAGGLIDHTFESGFSFKPGHHVGYWSSSLFPDDNSGAYVFGQNGEGNMIVTATNRYIGHSIRAVLKR